MFVLLLGHIGKGERHHERIAARHPALHRQHLFVGLAQHRAEERLTYPAKTGKREPHRQHRMALAMIEVAEADGTSQGGWFCRRIYRRQHRRVPVSNLRGEGISSAYRDFGCFAQEKLGHDSQPLTVDRVSYLA